MMWSSVELREVRVFLTLCEEMHFGRTAERLHVSPSRISQVLHDLERKLGGQLVYRTSRSVRLTSLGQRFRARVNGPYAQFATAVELTRTESRSIDGVVRVGLFSAPAAGPHLKAVIDAFEVQHPTCNVETTEVPFDDPFGPITHGAIPLMATWLPHGQVDLVTGPTLNREPRVLLVAADHPLATSPCVVAEDLANYRVPRFDRMPHEFREVWIPTKTPQGRPIPSVQVEMTQRDYSQLGMRIARGELVHPTIPSAVQLFAASIKLTAVPIIGLPPWRSALIWKRRSIDAKEREFVRIAAEVVKAARARRIAGGAR